MSHDHGFFDRRMSNHRGFDLAELNPVAADFDLMVTAPEKLNIAAGTITSAIAGSVEMCIRIVAERITNKSFCG